MANIKLTVTHDEYKQLIFSLLAARGMSGVELVHRLHEQDPADDGPEVEIIRRAKCLANICSQSA